MHAAFNLDQMEIDEKFLIMEQIWENLSADAMEQGFTPKWHMDILGVCRIAFTNIYPSEAKKR